MLNKIMSGVMSIAMVMTFSNYASDRNQVTASAVEQVSYISENEAEAIANRCVQNQIGQIGCRWNDTTRIYETVPFSDPFGNTNSYLFRVITDEELIGYIFVDAFGENPHVQAFEYDCDFMLDSMYEQNHDKKVDKSDEIIYNNGFSFLTREETGEYKSVVTDEILEQTETEIKKEYKEEKEEIAREQAGEVSPLAQVVYTNKHLDGVYWDDDKNNFNFVPYTMIKFVNENHCTPTAATNLVYYWGTIKPGGHYGLWNGSERARNPSVSVFCMLYAAMRSEYEIGTYFNQIIPGLTAFSRARYDLIAGSGYQEDGLLNGVTWNFIKNNVDKSYPVLIGTNNDSKYGNHSLLCVGYQECSDGNYLRVADGWSATISNFYYFKGSIIHASYVRW